MCLGASSEHPADLSCALQSNSFDQFKTSLASTSTRFARSVQSGKGNARIQLGIVGGVVVLFLLYKLLGGSGSGP